MFHSDIAEFAFLTEKMELLEECQHEKHEYYSPLLAWPSVCKTDLSSFQSLKMYPELNKAAEKYSNLIYEKLVVRGLDNFEMCEIPVQFVRTRGLSMGRDLKGERELAQNDEIFQAQFLDEIEKRPEVKRALVTLKVLLIQELGWKTPSKCFWFHLNQIGTATKDCSYLETVIWYDADSKAKVNSCRLIPNSNSDLGWKIPSKIRGSVLFLHNRKRFIDQLKTLNSYNLPGTWSLEYFYKYCLLCKRTTGIRGDQYRKILQMRKKSIYKNRQDCKDMDEYDGQFMEEIREDVKNNLSYEQLMELMAQSAKSRIDIDRQKMCRKKCKSCDDIKIVAISERVLQLHKTVK